MISFASSTITGFGVRDAFKENVTQGFQVLLMWTRLGAVEAEGSGGAKSR